MSLAGPIGAIDAANAADPNLVADPFSEPSGMERPKELVHADRMTYWLHRLCASPDDAQVLAARAHHFRRWTRPRTDYPEGRAGYLRWRKDAKATHAIEVDALLSEHGVAAAVRADAMAIIRKDGLASDPRVQIHEDALCLVFFELQGLSTAALLGERTGFVVEKTLRKMSATGRSLIAEATIDPAVRDVIASVIDGVGSPP